MIFGMEKFKRCNIANCDGNAHWTVSGAKGLCKKHYARLLRNGDALAGRTSPGELHRYLCEVVLTYEGNDCLTWPYSRNAYGYAVMQYEGRQQKVARIACAERHGPAPTPDHLAAHSCGKGHESCVAMSHLRWATPQENSDDRELHGTVPRGEQRWNSKLTADDVRRIRSMTGTMTQAEIGKLFGIGQVNVGMILRRQAWAWVD